jgi:hypothetical protein
VNVCGAPTAFVADGAMWILAFTHVFVAGPELAPVPSVFLASTTPPTTTVLWALTVVTPVTDEVSVTWQEPVPPVVVHGFGVVNEPGPESIVELIDVPSGAGTNPEPSFTFTCAVNVCDAATRFVPFGVIWTFTSTHVLLALRLPPDAVFCAVPVVRVIEMPLIGMSDVAETTVMPAVADVIVTVQLAVAAPPV